MTEAFTWCFGNARRSVTTDLLCCAQSGAQQLIHAFALLETSVLAAMCVVDPGCTSEPHTLASAQSAITSPTDMEFRAEEAGVSLGLPK